MSSIPPIASAIHPLPTQPLAARTGGRVAGGTPPLSGLHEVLTAEERAYFDAVAALGPVSYGRAGAASALPTAPLGQRLDVTG